jgi:AmpD protein
VTIFRVNNHILQPARLLPSPNHSERTQGSAVDLLVIHNISLPPGEFGTGCVDDLFCNNLDFDAHPYFRNLIGLQVSAHLLIDRSGHVTQYVPFDRKAWHAGQSCFAGRENCNEYSIGIELEGTDDMPFTESQYAVLIDVARALMSTYPGITAERIVGHRDIAPGRKTDPGPWFDWNRLKAHLIQQTAGVGPP